MEVLKQSRYRHKHEGLVDGMNGILYDWLREEFYKSDRNMKEKNRTKIGEIFKFGGILWQKVRHDDYPSDEDELEIEIE